MGFEQRGAWNVPHLSLNKIQFTDCVIRIDLRSWSAQDSGVDRTQRIGTTRLGWGQVSCCIRRETEESRVTCHKKGAM